MWKNLLKVFNALYPFSDFLYILQLEEYETDRYFRRIKRFFLQRNLQRRGRLVMTIRVRYTLVLAIPFSLFTPPLIPFWIGIANFILSPYFSYIKNNIQKRASMYFAKTNTKTKVIAIAGSYGKTTTKNYIYELIRYSYKTQMVPGNINTPTGIANWVLSEYDPSSEFLIVEVDAYFIGEIRKSLLITPPDIAILTNIADQHLERLGSKQNLKKALLDVFNYSKPGAVQISGKKTSLEYALEMAKILKVPKDIVKDTVSKLAPPERRKNITKIDNFEVIDDSYNISENTARIGIAYAKQLADKHKKKLIVITAGIPELGDENKDGNINLGKILDQKADSIILLGSILAPEVETGIKHKKKITYASSMQEAIERMTAFDFNKNLVLMQPELNDLYY